MLLSRQLIVLVAIFLSTRAYAATTTHDFGILNIIGDPNTDTIAPGPTERWDTGDTLIADFGVNGRIGGISGGKNVLVIPEVSVFGNTIIPEVRADTRTGFRFTGNLNGRAGAVLFAEMTPGGGNLDGAIGYGPSLSLPSEIRAGRFFSMSGSKAVNHSNFNLDLDLPTLSAGVDLLIEGSGRGKVEWGLFPFTGYQVGDFNFNLPDIRLPVIDFNLDLNLPRLPDFNFLGLPQIPASNAADDVFRKRIQSGTISYAEFAVSNPVGNDQVVNTVSEGTTLVNTVTGPVARFGLDIDGILTGATTGVSFTGLEQKIGNNITVGYDTVDVKYGIETGYKLENRLDSFFEVTLEFVDPSSTDANPISTQVLLSDAGGTRSVTSWTGRWDQLPDLALLSDDDISIDIDFTGIKRELKQTGSLTFSDYMELRILAAKAELSLGTKVNLALKSAGIPRALNLGPLWSQKFALAGTFADFEVYSKDFNLLDLGIPDGFWDDRVALNVIQNVDVFFKSATDPLGEVGSYLRLDDHLAVTNLADKVLVIGTAGPNVHDVSGITPISYVDEGTTSTAMVDGGNVFNSDFRTVTVPGVQDGSEILSITGLLVPQGSTYTNQGIRRFDLVSVENDGVIDNEGWLDFRAPNGLLTITGNGTIYFGARDDNAGSALGTITGLEVFHTQGHTLDFGPHGRYRGNIDALASDLLGPEFSNTITPLTNGLYRPRQTAHEITIGGNQPGGQFSNAGKILVRGSDLSIDEIAGGFGGSKATFANSETGVIEITGGVSRGSSFRRGGLLVSDRVILKNSGLIEAHGSAFVQIESTEIQGSGSEQPGIFRSKTGSSIHFSDFFNLDDLNLSGNLDFVAEGTGQVNFNQRLVVGPSSQINLISDPGSKITLRGGLHREDTSGRINIVNEGLLDIVSGRSSLRVEGPLNPGGGGPSSAISPIDLVNNGTVRVHDGAEFAFDIDITNYADGGATLTGGAWELLGTNTRFANTGSVTSANRSQAAIIDVQVASVFGNADKFSDLAFHSVEDQNGNVVEVTDISQLDTRLVYNNADVTLSGAAKFDYFNTVEVNRGDLNLLNQHQFNTIDSLENRGGTIRVDSGAGLHVAKALFVNGGDVTFDGNSELTVNGADELQLDGTLRRRDIEVSGGTLTINQGTKVNSGLISRTRTDGLLLQAGRSWAVRDSVGEDTNGNEIVTPGIIDLGVVTSNGVAGVVRNNAEVVISGASAEFRGFESSLLYQHGSLLIADGKEYVTPNNYFRNANEMTLSGGLFRQGNGEFRNDGLLTIDADSFFDVDFLNALTGEINVDGVVNANRATIATDVNLTGGTFNSKNVALSGAGQFIVNGGTLLTESFDGTLTIDTGAFAPGQSIGIANVAGDYTQSANAVLEIEWDNTAGDLVDIDQVANLDGLVQISFLGGFAPTIGTSLEFLTAASIFGQFNPEVWTAARLPGVGFALRYETTSVFLDVVAAPVPLPGAVWLFGSALIGLVTVRREYRKTNPF